MSNIYLAETSIINLTATSPFTTTFVPSAIATPNGFCISDICYDFGDGSPLVYTAGIATSGAQLTNVSHTYHRALSSDNSTIHTTITAYEYVTLTPIIYRVNIALSLPAFTTPISLLESRALRDGSTFVVLELDQTTTNQICNVIVKPTSQANSHAQSTSCPGPTNWNASRTLTAVASTVLGAAVTGSSASGNYIFVSDAGYYAAPNYGPVAALINAASADAALFGGNNNYSAGAYGSLVNNWSGYNAYVLASAAYPALGVRDLKGSTLNDTVNNALIFSGSTWKYTVIQQPSSWSSASYVTSSWLTGATPMGYGSGLSVETQITGVSGASGCTVDQLITSIYATKDFTVTNAAITASNCLRIRYRFNDAIAIYINGNLLVTDGLSKPYNDTDPRPKQTSSITTIPSFINAYVAISALSVGNNRVSVRTIAGHPGNNDMIFDLELATVTANNLALPVSYGAAQLQKFNYLPGNRRYYKVNLPGNADLFVLNSGINNGSNYIVEYDDVAIGGQQYSWLVDQVNQSTARWKIVMFHVPYIASTGSSRRVWPQFNWGLESLGVDLLLNGYAGVNEHLRDGNLNIVNCSAVVEISDVTSISPNSVWIDGRNGNTAKGAPAIVKIVATQQQLAVQFVAVSNQSIIHEFKVT